MKNRHVILFAIFCVLLVILSAANVYISVRNKSESDKKIERAIALYEKADRKMTTETIANEVSKIELKPGKDGKDGVTTIVNKVVHEYTPAPEPKNGKDAVVDYALIENIIEKKIAEKLAELPQPKDGRTPIINIDQDTGDVLLRYQGDTLWTLLMEKCELTNTCEE